MDNRRDHFKVIDIFVNNFIFLWRGDVGDNLLVNDYLKTQKIVNDKPKG
jgi:hypothetical protein